MTWASSLRTNRGVQAGAVALLVVVSLGIFTFTIADGRLSGPATMLALSVGALAVCSFLLFEAARALVTTSADDEKQESQAATGRRKRELEREYHALKRALKELELDHAMGKVSPDDYAEIRTRYRERAVRVLRQLDQGETYRSQIEQDLRARRVARGLPERPVERPTAAPGDAPEAEAAPAAASPSSESESAPRAAVAASAAPALSSIPAGAQCPSCRASNDTDALFCKKCGQRLASA